MTTTLHERPSQCVHCGYCCMKHPCPYGEVDTNTGWCRHLVLDEASKHNQYLCKQYEVIKKMKDAWFCPAFGAGCSSTLFNEQRNKIVAGIKGEVKVK